MEQLLGNFSLGLFILQTVLFIGLVLLLKKFAWKPILDAVNEREEGIKSALQAAEKARKEMQDVQSNNEKLLAEARLERDAMIKEAREIREKMIVESKSKAEEEGRKMIEYARLSIENEKQAAVAEIKAQVSQLSLQIAEKVLISELSNNETQAKLVDRLLSDTTSN